jgi:hypothetical protein
MTEDHDNILSKIKEYIKKAAEKYNVKTCNVSTAQFWSVTKHIKEWQVRKLGGFNSIRDTLYPSAKKDDIQPRIKKKFKPKIHKLENFTVHDVNLTTLFKSANLKNDDVFKMIFLWI